MTTLFPGRSCEEVSIRLQCRALRRLLAEIDPGSVVIAGYKEPCMRAATEWARAHGRPVALQFVSTYADHARKWWRELLKTRLMKRYAVIAATGVRAEEYALRLGANQDRIHKIGNVVDNAHYATGSELARQEGDRLRKELGMPSRYFLTVARLSPEKNLAKLVDAYGAYRGRGGEWDLVIIGSGPQQEELRSQAKLGGIHFLPWKSYEELPHYYGFASCFVLASLSETWGLVVNEAMACGLPVLVSRNCGCVPELCRDEQNGFTFDPNSVEELAGMMLRMSSVSPEELSAFGHASQRIIAAFTPETWAANLKSCITAAINAVA